MDKKERIRLAHGNYCLDTAGLADGNMEGRRPSTMETKGQAEQAGGSFAEQIRFGKEPVSRDATR